MEMHPCWRLLISGISIFASFAVVTFSVNKYNTPFLVTAFCFSICVTGFVVTLIAATHIMCNRHVRRNTYITRNKCCDEATSLRSSNHDIEAGYSSCHSEDSLENPYHTRSDPWPIPGANDYYNHPSPMPRKSYLVDDFMLTFFRLARGDRVRRIRTYTVSESAVDDKRKKTHSRCRSRNCASDDDEKPQHLGEEHRSESSIRSSSTSSGIFALDIDDDELYVKTKND